MIADYRAKISEDLSVAKEDCHATTAICLSIQCYLKGFGAGWEQLLLCRGNLKLETVTGHLCDKSWVYTIYAISSAGSHPLPDRTG